MSETPAKPAETNPAPEPPAGPARGLMIGGGVLLALVFGGVAYVVMTWPVEAPLAEPRVQPEEVEKEDATKVEFVEPTGPSSLDRFASLADIIARKKSVFESLDFASGVKVEAGPRTAEGRQSVWQIRFAASNLDAYAKQLDFFEFELAAVGGGEQIDYLSNLSQRPGKHRVGNAADEKRPYFTWRRDSLLAENDRTLMQRASLPLENRIIIQYYPDKLFQKLAELEKAAAKGKQPEKTIFGVVPAGEGFEFRVEEQLLAQ